MSKSKYVVGLARAGHMEQVVAMIFPECVVHFDVALMFFGSKNRILGAGFCHLEEREGHATTMVASGESVSLDIRSRPEDVGYLNETMGLDDQFSLGHVPALQRRQDHEAVRAKIRAANATIGVIPDRQAAANE